MLKIRYYTRENSADKLPIYVRVTNGRAFDLKARTKETCIPSLWDEQQGFLKERIFVEKNGRLIEKRDADTQSLINENKTINSRLRKLSERIEEDFKTSINTQYDTNWLKEIINPQVNNKAKIPDSFLEYCDVFMEQKKFDISKAYLTKIKSIKEIIAKFIKYKKKKTLNLNEIDLQFATDFIDFSINILKYQKSYANRNIKFIKTIAFHAETNGVALNSQIRKIKVSNENTEFQILTFEELKKIKEYNFDKQNLNNIRDWLLISCYTGQRVSDFMRFNTDMITKKEVEGREQYFIEFTQMKTEKKIRLPLHQEVLEILNKRGFKFPPKYSEQKYNKLIKEVCKKVEINESCHGGISINKRKQYDFYPKYKLVSSHIGRRSFASNYYGKIPTPLLMSATGHSTENMFLKYIGKVDNQQSEQLANYFYE